MGCCRYPQNYSYLYRPVCFCAFTNEVRVVVQSDSVIDVTDIKTNQTFMWEVNGGLVPIKDSLNGLFFTINTFFEMLEDEVPNSSSSELEFNADTGMPIFVYIDPIQNIADDEISYRFSNLDIN